MRPAHYISIAVAAVLTAVLYFGATTVQPKKPGMPAADAPHMAAADDGHEHTPGDGHQHVASPDSILAKAKAKLPAHGLEEIAALEKGLPKEGEDSTAAIQTFERLADAYREHRQPIAATHYRAIAARLAGSPEKLTFAGRSALGLLESPQTPPDERLWAAQTAVALLTRALAQTPDADTLQLALAVAHIEGTGETMQGVQQLLAITRKTPDHIPANLLLGRLAVQSAQWDKAAGRFQTVLRQEPDNVEALLGLADTYRGKGEKEEAIKIFSQAKAVVNKPEFTRDIDAYIKTFSSSN